MIKFSIVTISYNQADYLEEAILSVVNQEHPNVEYIVVDPGSTDGSRCIIEKYRRYIAQVILKSDKGPADGLNNGFYSASGDVFGFLNADDTLLPGALSSAGQYFMNNVDVDVVSGHAQIIDSLGNVRRRVFSDRYRIAMAAYGASTLVQPSTFFRAETFRRCGGFNIENLSNWDSELYLEMALHGARFCLVNEFWSRYRVHGESITGSGRLQGLHESHRNKMFERVKMRPMDHRDIAAAFLLKYLRKALNLRDTMERVRFGAIFRSSASG
jgi:glycosyltransferase involved in cell wall biosynthesis